MRVDLAPGLVRLARRQTLRVRGGAGATVCAAEGIVWITEEDNLQDVILEAGGCYRLRRPGLALVSAMSDATVTLN